jgi:hypothetical protein
MLEKRAVRHAARVADVGAVELAFAGLAAIRDTPANRNAIPVGTVEFCLTWMARCAVSVPEPLDFPLCLAQFLGRRVRQVGGYHNAPAGAWVKPVRTKAWDAHVKPTISPQMPVPEGEVWTSEPLQLLAEWRVYVREGRVLGDGRYDNGEDDSLVFCPETVSAMVAAFENSGGAPRGYALDVALTDSGRTVLVEATDGWAIGYYKGSCAPVAYAELLAARWRELASKSAE